jgi:hypothetical protein
MPDEPLRTTTYTLTTADALAYEQAASRMTPLGVLALLLWLGLWGAAAMLIPPDWVGPRLGWSFSALVAILVCIAYVMALILIAVRQWLRARHRIKRPIEQTVAEWPDRLEFTGGGMPRTLNFPDVRRTILTRTHLLLEADEDVLIVPRRAFAEEGSIEDLAQRIEATPRAAPVDPGAASA